MNLQAANEYVELPPAETILILAKLIHNDSMISCQAMDNGNSFRLPMGQLKSPVHRDTVLPTTQ
ncbi:hypothetical protein AB833_23145 [Chromatiales bacterium (ex Bugula neritina AB1)]|nr:hypothetical protein AB833_23145 [Chromatiales bacterium (ex Bugula neritina AB1)]